MQRRHFLLGAGALSLGACTKPKYDRATKAQAASVRYEAGPPYYLALENMVNANNDVSEHTGLLINGSQRVLYDPAGAYFVKGRPRRLDVHYGMNDQWVEDYESFHARLDYYVVKQKIYVSKDIADLAIRRSEEQGETYQWLCAVSISKVLKGIPGFESINQTISPDGLMRDFAKLPGIEREEIRESDTGKNYRSLAIENYDPNDTAPPRKPEIGRGGGELGRVLSK